MTANRNSFEALCVLASKEHWCWKIHCTTCGHMYFRHGLHEILLGKHPESPSWLVSESNPILFRGGQPKSLGKLPPRWESWPIDEQQSLSQILIGVDLLYLRENCSYPDWLGYHGLALFYTEDTEKESRNITKALVPQLQKRSDIVSPKSNFLQGILNDEIRVLSWINLEALE